MFPDYFARLINSYGNLMESMYIIYMNSIDSCLVFLNKNREAFDHNKNQNMDSFKIYMEGYEKAKKDLGAVDINNREPADVYF